METTDRADFISVNVERYDDKEEALSWQEDGVTMGEEDSRAGLASAVSKTHEKSLAL